MPQARRVSVVGCGAQVKQAGGSEVLDSSGTIS
jgi:hypothetical protein